MSKEDDRMKQTLKFLIWKKKYSGFWKLICESDNENMNLKKMQMLVKQLEKDELYELIFVLLEVHKNKEFIKSLREDLLMDFLISEWKNGNKDKFIKKFVKYSK